MPETAAFNGLAEITAEMLAERLGTRAAPAIIDVRQPEEFSSWAIAGVRNIPLAELSSSMAAIERDTEVVVVCASGARSGRAVEALRAAGVAARNLTGGMLAWAAVYDTAWFDAGTAGVVQLRRRGKGCLSYVVGAGGQAIAVDPSLDFDRYRNAAAARGWEIVRVFDTHLHADHVSGARLLAEATGATLHLGAGDAPGFPHEPVRGGEEWRLGDTGVAVRSLAAPGHTMGSLVLDVCGKALLSGDSLFVDGVGRPDLADDAETYARQLHRTLRTVFGAMPDDTLVLPAHYGEPVAVTPGVPVGRSLGDLRASLPQLGWDEPEFVSWASTRARPRPPRYAEIVRVNTGEVAIDVEAARRLELGPNRCAA